MASPLNLLSGPISGGLALPDVATATSGATSGGISMGDNGTGGKAGMDTTVLLVLVVLAVLLSGR